MGWCPLVFYVIWQYTKCSWGGGGSTLTIKKNMNLAVANKEKDLEVNADGSKCLLISRDQNVGKNYIIKNDKKYFERVKHFKYLGTTLKNLTFIQEKIKISLKSGNACYHSLQKRLCSGSMKKYKI
jgi:hypothetical protein